MTGPNLVLLGEFGRAHGLKGEVRLKSFTADPLAIAGYGPLTGEAGHRVRLTHVRPATGAAPDILVARVEGVTSREAAEALNRKRLFIERDRLGVTDEEDEFLLVDLVGLRVEDQAGQMLGTVIEVPNYGGGDLLNIREANGRASALLPFTKEFVPVVDVAGGRVVAHAPPDLFAPAKSADPDGKERP
jgi:16S rRNA processing protein RimM